MQIKNNKFLMFLIVFLIALGIWSPFAIRSCSNEIEDSDVMQANKYDLDIVIDSKGDMTVKERIVIDNYINNYNNFFYKEISYKKINEKNSFGDNRNNRSYIRDDIKLTVEERGQVVYESGVTPDLYPTHFAGTSINNDIDERGDYIECEDPNQCEMVFYYDKPGFARITTFTYEYKIEGVITQYNDISEFNWVLLDYQPFNIFDITINITFPEGDYVLDENNTFFHGTYAAQRYFADSNQVVIKAADMIPGERIETRMLFDDNKTFSEIRGINKVNYTAKDEIIAFQEKQIKTAEIKDAIGIYGPYVLYYGFAIAIICIGIYCYRKYDKEFESDFYNEYYRELPADYPPAIMGYLYRFREITDDDLTATLLDLIRRKYLILEHMPVGANENNADFKIKKNNELQQKGLKNFESFLIKWFIDDIGNGECVTSRQLNSYCRNEAGARSYQSSCTTWYKMVKAEGKKRKFFDEVVHNKKTRFIIISVLSIPIVIVLLNLMDSFSRFNIGGPIAMFFACFPIALILYVNTIDRRSKKGNEDYVRWKAFKHFLEDFGSFEDYPVPALIIWEHYLVYATSFGIADKVRKQLKLKLDLESIDSTTTTYIYYFGRYNSFGRFNRSIRSMRTISRGTIATANAARAASSTSRRSGGGSGSFSSRGGGGFSGGSSFGGGGGSFGGGRR